jgi:hypothetical protein
VSDPREPVRLELHQDRSIDTPAMDTLPSDVRGFIEDHRSRPYFDNMNAYRPKGRFTYRYPGTLMFAVLLLVVAFLVALGYLAALRMDDLWGNS